MGLLKCLPLTNRNHQRAEDAPALHSRRINKETTSSGNAVRDLNFCHRREVAPKMCRRAAAQMSPQ
jgi:hypothetical protein